MQTYTQYNFNISDAETTGRLIAYLVEAGFEGFEEQPDALSAFIPTEKMPADSLGNFKQIFPNISFSIEEIAPQNWNQIWESGFEPVRVHDFVGIRADFHNPMQGVKYELQVTPKMSFGTGHHATTFQMVEHMEQIPFDNKTVIDYGTGTGVLAILAEKLGASKVVAIDYDENCIENAAENISANHCSKIELQLANTITVTEPVDCILANINLHIILDQLTVMHNALKPNGHLLLSGLLESDEVGIIPAVESAGFGRIHKTVKNGWMAVHAYRI